MTVWNDNAAKFATTRESRLREEVNITLNEGMAAAMRCYRARELSVGRTTLDVMWLRVLRLCRESA